MSGQAPSYRRPRLHNFGEAAALSSPAFIVLYIDAPRWKQNRFERHFALSENRAVFTHSSSL